MLFVRGHLGAAEPGVLGLRPSHRLGQHPATPSSRAASSQLSLELCGEVINGLIICCWIYLFFYLFSVQRPRALSTPVHQPQPLIIAALCMLWLPVHILSPSLPCFWGGSHVPGGYLWFLQAGGPTEALEPCHTGKLCCRKMYQPLLLILLHPQGRGRFAACAGGPPSAQVHLQEPWQRQEPRRGGGDCWAMLAEEASLVFTKVF